MVKSWYSEGQVTQFTMNVERFCILVLQIIWFVEGRGREILPNMSVVECCMFTLCIYSYIHPLTVYHDIAGTTPGAVRLYFGGLFSHFFFA